jgi:L-amino acid N-acyltransferase YncA
MDYAFRPFLIADQGALLSIYNHYIKNSYAAYFEDQVDESFLLRLRQMISSYPFYVIETSAGEVIGFGLIHRYHPAKAFDRTAELTYFISPSHTGMGLGTKLLDLLSEKAVQMKIDTLLASISSLNQQSLDFHKKNGFVECGRFIKVGRKFGRDFDMVWMQKHLASGPQGTK